MGQVEDPLSPNGRPPQLPCAENPPVLMDFHPRSQQFAIKLARRMELQEILIPPLQHQAHPHTLRAASINARRNCVPGRKYALAISTMVRRAMALR